MSIPTNRSVCLSVSLCFRDRCLKCGKCPFRVIGNLCIQPQAAHSFAFCVCTQACGGFLHLFWSERKAMTVQNIDSPHPGKADLPGLRARRPWAALRMALLRGPPSHLGPQRAPWVPTSQPPPSDWPHFLQRVELGLAKTRWCVREARGDRAKCQELQTENLLDSRGAWPEQSLNERGQGSSFWGRACRS